MDVDSVLVKRAPVTFDYEFNFAEAPSDVTDQRWESLFPSNAGFFEHPAAGDRPVTFSVFHQLHCLVRVPSSLFRYAIPMKISSKCPICCQDGLRFAYWNARNGNHSEGEHSQHAEHSSEVHVRHCLEYIRQSIVCLADTTIERTVDATEGHLGVEGFGTVHMCKDFRQLVEWTSRWE